MKHSPRCLKIQSPSFISQQMFCKVLEQKDAEIARQSSLICQLQEKLQVIVRNVKKMKEGKNFSPSKMKLNVQEKNRTEISKQMKNQVNAMKIKLNKIEDMVLKKISEDLDRTNASEKIINENSPLVSTNISQIMSPTKNIDSPLKSGQMSQVSAESNLIELNTKTQYIKSIVQILVSKYENKQINFSNQLSPQKSKGCSEEELFQCRNIIQKERKQLNQLKKQMNLYEQEKKREREEINQFKKILQDKKLNEVSKERLMEEIEKLNRCLIHAQNKIEQKERQLVDFKEQEKRRYEDFLKKLRVNKK